METERVIALDPGGRSGWASAVMGVDYLEVTGMGVLRADHMADWLAEQQGIVYGGESAPNRRRAFDVVVHESWYPRRKGGKMDWIENDELQPAQHVGQVKWIALASGARLVEQHPSDKDEAQRTMPKVLEKLNLYSNEQHDQDARMHLWLYFFREWFTATKDPEYVVLV